VVGSPSKRWRPTQASGGAPPEPVSHRLEQRLGHPEPVGSDVELRAIRQLRGRWGGVGGSVGARKGCSEAAERQRFVRPNEADRRRLETLRPSDHIPTPASPPLSFPRPQTPYCTPRTPDPTGPRRVRRAGASRPPP